MIRVLHNDFRYRTFYGDADNNLDADEGTLSLDEDDDEHGNIADRSK